MAKFDTYMSFIKNYKNIYQNFRYSDLKLKFFKSGIFRSDPPNFISHNVVADEVRWIRTKYSTFKKI